MISRGTEFFCPAKHIDLIDPQITATIQKDVSDFIITLTALSPAFYVELSLENADAVFSDNCFYLPSDKPVTVSVKKESVKGLSSCEEFLSSLKVWNLFDTYE